MTAPTIVETRRLHLPELGRLWNDPEVMRWVGHPDGLGISSTELDEWFDRMQRDPLRHHFVILVEDGDVAGEVFYAVDSPPVSAGLDIKVHRRWQGRGVATASLSALIDLVFANEPTVDVVWTEPATDNEAARRLYSRCGLRRGPRPSHLPPGPSWWCLERCERTG